MVNLPDSGGSVQTGIKPCLVVSNDFGNRFGPTLVVVPMTSKIAQKTSLPTHYILEKDKYKFLKYDSLVLCEQVITIPKSCVLRKIGYIPKTELSGIESCLKIELALS